MRLSIILLFSFFFVSLHAQEMKFEDKEKLVINKIKSRTQWLYKYKGGVLSQEGRKNYYILYDKMGNTIETTYYKPNGNISLKLTYKYDENGNKVGYISYDGDKKSVTYKQSIKYDEEGKKMREMGFDGVNPYRISYKYDKDGNILEIVNYKYDGSIDEKRIFERNGLETDVLVYANGKKLVSRLFQKYDENGNMLEDVMYNASKKEVKRVVFKYNEKGLLKEKEDYRSGKLISHEDYEYNQSGLLVKVYRKENNGKSFLNNSYAYFVNGDLKEEKWFDGDHDDYSRRFYKYDEKGNLIEMDCYYSLYKYQVLYKYSYSYH